MNIAVILALLGAGFNTANDLIYRISSLGKNRSRMISFYFTAAVSSLAVALIANITIYGGISSTGNDIFFGVILGILSLMAYMLFLFSLSGGNISIGVTIFRLNMIPGILLAVVFLNESISLRRGIGILLCIASILLITSSITKRAGDKSYLLVSIAACLFSGVLNYVNKVAVSAGCEPFKLLIWRFLTVSILCGILVIKGKYWMFSLDNLKFAFPSGFFLVVAVAFILEAMKTADVALVLPITQMAFVFVSIISWVFLGEKTNYKKLIGVAMAVGAVILVS